MLLVDRFHFIMKTFPNVYWSNERKIYAYTPNVVQDNWNCFNKFMHYNANSRAKYNSNNRPLRSDVVASCGFETRDVIRNITHILYSHHNRDMQVKFHRRISSQFHREKEGERNGKTFCESRVINADFSSSTNKT